MEDGVFRSKKGFTVVQNIIAKNDGISLKAKGLYLVIQANITMPNKKWKKEDFMKMTLEGKKAFDSAWAELKEKGYLKMYKKSQKEGFMIMYELLDEPMLGAHTFCYSPRGELLSTNLGPVSDGEYLYFRRVFDDENVAQSQENSLDTQKGDIGKKSLDTQKGYIGNNSLDTQKGDIGNGEVGKGDYPNGDCNNINTNELNTKENKDSSNQILSNESETECCVRGEDEMGQGCNITLDITRDTYLDALEDCRYYLEDNNGLPLDFAFEPEKMTIAILALCGWDSRIIRIKERNIDSGRVNEEDEIYVTMVRNLIEMATSKTTVIGGTRNITYKHVNDKINQIYHKAEFKAEPLRMLIEQSIRRFQEASKKTQIVKIDAYCKSIIWNSFDTFVMDWYNYFNRTYSGSCNN